MLANIFLSGPEKNLMTLRHGVNPAHADKAKIEEPLVALAATYASITSTIRRTDVTCR